MSEPEVSSNPKFFIVVAPGLEELALLELKSWFPNLQAVAEKGGLTVETDLATGLEFNRVLKIPTRVLLRLAEFSARDFPKLFKKISGLEWSKWLTNQTPVEFQASSHGSRLSIKKRIESTALDARKAYLKKLGQDPKPNGPAATVLLRVFDDICTVSLDTSGERLHKRGLRTLSSDAPLRETIAAALLWFMISGLEVPEHSVELVDPMTGGGTFLLEAMGLGRANPRESFATLALAHLQARADQPRFHGRDPFQSFRGMDSSEKAISSAKENISHLKETRSVHLDHADLVEAAPLPPLEKGERWVIANPPYGERLKIEGAKNEFFEKIFEACEKLAQPTRACFLLPEKAHPDRLKSPKGWKRLKVMRFSNGGIPVVAVLFVRKSS